MSDFKVDFTNVEVKNFDPMPTGKYLLCVTDFEESEVKEGKNEGEPRIQFEFTVQEPTHVVMDGNETKIENRKVWENFYPTIGTTLFRLKDFLTALGDNTEGEMKFNPDEIMARSADSRLLVAKLKVSPTRKDKKTGKEYAARNEIQNFYPASTWKNTAAASSGPKAATSLLP